MGHRGHRHPLCAKISLQRPSSRALGSGEGGPRSASAVGEEGAGPDHARPRDQRARPSTVAD